MIGRHIKALLSVVLALIGFVGGFAAKNVDESGENAQRAHEQAIRVMSYNVQTMGSGELVWHLRKDTLTDQIREYMPDVFGVQEAHFFWITSILYNMPEYDYVGVARDNGKKRGEYSAIFYLKDVYEVLDSGTFWLSETPDTPSFGWDAACRRVCTWAVLKNIETEKTFACLNTHLDHKGTQARTNSVDLILEKAEELAEAMPVVITGDFNFSEGTSNYDRMIEGILGDAKHMAPDTMSSGTFNGFRDEDISEVMPIDFCFVTKDDVSPLKYEVITDKPYYDKPASDHFPLYVDFLID